MPTDRMPAVMRHVMAYNGEPVGTIPIINPHRTTTVTTDATAGAITYTGAQLLGGLILRNPNGAGRADLVPTAAALIAAMPGAAVGQSFEFTIRNTAGAAETITVTTNTGATLSGTMTIAQSNTKRFLVVITGIGTAAAYSVYSLGTSTH